MNREAFHRFHRRLQQMFGRPTPQDRKYHLTTVSIDSQLWDSPPITPGPWKMLSVSVQGYQAYVLWERDESTD